MPKRGSDQHKKQNQLNLEETNTQAKLFERVRLSKMPRGRFIRLSHQEETLST